MSDSLRIGINALYLIPGGVGGTEIYLRSLLAALAELNDRHEYFVFTNAETGSDLVPSSSRFHFIPTGVNARFRPGRVLYEQIVLPRLLRRHSIDVLLNPGFTGPVSLLNQSVTVFHDLQHKRHPEFFRWFDRPFWGLLLGASARRSRSLIAVSQATAADLVRYYPATQRKIAVVPHGVDPEFFRIGERRASRKTPETAERYLLAVSTLHPHKNIERLLEAFREFRKSCPAFGLVVAGLKGFAARTLAARRRDLKLEDSVRFTGWIPRADLYKLFEDADAFISPSEFEGFGMPVVEALAAGLPVACSDIAPFREVAGDAAVRFAPDSVAGMLEAMRKITSDEEFRAGARIAGPARARLFDWRRTARLTLDALEKAGRAT